MSEAETISSIGIQLAGESIKYFMLNVLYTGVLAIASIIVARLLGPAGYGEYSLSLVIPATLILLAPFGVFPGLVKYISSAKIKNPRLINRYFYSALAFIISVSLVLALILYLFAGELAYVINRPKLSGYIQLLALLPIFQMIQMVILNYYIGLGKSSISGWLNFIMGVVKASTMTILVVVGMGVFGAVAGHLTGYIVGGLIGLFYTLFSYTKRNDIGFNNDTDDDIPTIGECIKTMITYGIPIYLSGILVTVGNQYINAVLAWFVSNKEIGGFVAARNLLNLITIFVAPISINLFPAFSMIESSDRSLIPIAFSRAIRLSQLFILPIVGYLIVYGSEVLEIIYGYSFSFAGIYTVLLAISFILYPILIVNIGYFNGVNEARNTFKTNLVSFAGIMILSPLFAYFLGVVGVVIVLIIASLASAIYSIRLVKNEELPIESLYSIKILTLVVGITIVTYILRSIIHINPIIDIVIGAITYLVLYLILLVYTGIPSYQDIDFIDRSFRNIPFIGFITHYFIEIILALRRWIKR